MIESFYRLEALYISILEESDDKPIATSMLSTLLKREDLTTKQEWETAVSLYYHSAKGSDARLLATSILLKQLSSSGVLENEKDVYSIFRAMVSQFHKLPQLASDEVE